MIVQRRVETLPEFKALSPDNKINLRVMLKKMREAFTLEVPWPHSQKDVEEALDREMRRWFYVPVRPIYYEIKVDLT